MGKNYKKMTRKQLKALCKKRGIGYLVNDKKSELVGRLQRYDIAPTVLGRLSIAFGGERKSKR